MSTNLLTFTHIVHWVGIFCLCWAVWQWRKLAKNYREENLMLRKKIEVMVNNKFNEIDNRVDLKEKDAMIDLFVRQLREKDRELDELRKKLEEKK